jgi:hypothetical protein
MRSKAALVDVIDGAAELRPTWQASMLAAIVFSMVTKMFPGQIAEIERRAIKEKQTDLQPSRDDVKGCRCANDCRCVTRERFRRWMLGYGYAVVRCWPRRRRW